MLERVKKEALLTDEEIEELICKTFPLFDFNEEGEEARKETTLELLRLQADKFLNTNLGNISIGELIEDYLEEPVIDEEQELADRRHNASDDTIG